MKRNLRKLTAAWLLVIFLLFPALTRAETAVQAWVQRYNGPANGNDYATAVAVDASNNVIVTGNTGTIKYSSAGVPLWTNHYNWGMVLPSNLNNFQKLGNALALDGSNNVIVAGFSAGLGGPSDYTTIKYSSAGVPLWTNRYDGPANFVDRVSAVAVDGSNNVIVTGYSTGIGTTYDYATIKYSSEGVPLWTNRYYGLGNDYATAVAVDGSNNVIVTGQSPGSEGYGDYATIKYSSAGVPLWTNRYTEPNNELTEFSSQPTAVAVDDNNDVIVTGYSGYFDYTYGYYQYAHYTTIKYSSAGEPLWTNLYTEPFPGSAEACAVAVDHSGNVLVTGSGWNGTQYVYDDYATIKYSSAGVPLWTNLYDSPMSADDACALAVDGSNNVIVTGYSNNGTNADYLTIKYSSAGVLLWTNLYNGPGGGYNEAWALAVDHSGNVIVTGPSSNGTNADFATIKYICVPSPVLTGLNLSGGTFQLRLDQVLQPGTLVIEASTDLAGWAAIFTNTTPTNVLFYTDPEAGSNLWRFYRAFQFP